MKNLILVLNVGSSSIKFGAYACQADHASPSILFQGSLSEIGNDSHFLVTEVSGRLNANKKVQVADHETAFTYLLTWLQSADTAITPTTIGHRIVHGGLDYQVPALIDHDLLKRLHELCHLAPLHQKNSLSCVERFRRQWPDIPQVACFDTAFHASMAKQEQLFALPQELTSEGVRRYGFHGLSYEHIANILPCHLGDVAEKKVVVAHLGQGASMCAMRERHSVATSMSFTPLDGLPMATRCGSIDPSVILYLMREKMMDEAAISDLLNNRSGLLGISGISGDIRTLLSSEAPAAAEAMDFFVHKVSRELGSLVACLGGLDALVFTGGIGQNSHDIRARICDRAAWLGIQLDEVANANQRKCISKIDGGASVWILPTDEEFVIAQHAAKLLYDTP